MTTYDERATTRSVVGRLQPPDLTRMRCALVVIDLQVLDAAHDGEHAQRARELGRWGELEGYFDRVAESVVPNVVRLGRALRERGLPVIYLRAAGRCTPMRPTTACGSASSGSLRPRRPTGSAAARAFEIDDADLVLDKTTASPFWSTHLDRLLRQLEIECVLMTGVVTSGCVESAVRDASRPRLPSGDRRGRLRRPRGRAAR